MPHACVRAFGNRKQMICGMKNELLHVACSTKTLHVCHSLWQGEFTCNHKQVVNGLKPPRVSPHNCLVVGVKFPKGEGSAVIHHKKNDLLHKDATYIYVCVTYSLWKCEFTRNRKQVVNRLKIPQGLSTLLFRRWSEVPSRGGVRGDSP